MHCTCTEHILVLCVFLLPFRKHRHAERENSRSVSPSTEVKKKRKSKKKRSRHSPVEEKMSSPEGLSDS